MVTGLHTGFELDRRWHWLRGEMDETKKPALMLLARAFDDAGVSYAIIGGVAMQVHQDEPRTTLDIDVALGRYLPPRSLPSGSSELEPSPPPRTGLDPARRRFNSPTTPGFAKPFRERFHSPSTAWSYASSMPRTCFTQS